MVDPSHKSATPIRVRAYPFGMASACAYSGAYPTGHRLYQLSTEGVPSRLYDTQIASGFTHFQQSREKFGAIRKYYNYFRVTPMEESLDNLGKYPKRYGRARGAGVTTQQGSVQALAASSPSAPRAAGHRYTFQAHKDARLVIDFSMGGLAIPIYGAKGPNGRTLSRWDPGWLRRREEERNHHNIPCGV